MLNRRRITLAWTAALVAPCGALPSVQAQVVAPVALAQSQPEAPTNRFDIPLEGWIVVQFSVLADGSTDAIEVIDKMPPELDHRDAVAAVEGWRFEPATADGELIDWHNNEALIVFRSDPPAATPTPLFIQAYREVQALIDEGDYARALRNNERMLGTASRMIEIGLAQMQNANLHLRLGDEHAAYAAVVYATDPNVPTVEGDDLQVALQYRNALELQLGDVIGALETWERRNAIAPVPDDDIVAGNIAGIEQALSEGGTVVHKAKILDEFWRHALDRRTFAITVGSGEVEAIHVACNRRKTELEYSADAEWSLPESWGECSVAVEGRDATEFEFYEFQ